MPPNHQQYIQWNGERFRKWAEKIGENTFEVVSAILSGYKVEQQGYKSCMGLIKLADKYRQYRTILSMQMRSNFFVRHNKNPQAGYRPCQGFLLTMTEKGQADACLRRQP